MGSGPESQGSRLTSHEFGQWGESVTADHYEAAGFEIVERNWRCKDGEIDLIARRDSIVVFIEVKARTSDRFGTAADAVGWKKQQKVRSVARQWLARSSCSYQELRFDVAAVDRAGAVTVFVACF